MSTPAARQRATERFEAEFGESPRWLVRAPGRVNLIGEHTDYNDGFVLPLAIDRGVWIALRPRDDAEVHLTALDFEAEAGTFSLAALDGEGPGWLAYVRGVAWALQEAGHDPRGWEGIIAGDVPVGAGLSSSAALELAAARAFASASGIPWDPAAMARLGQRAENAWIGVQSGLMDQMISACGRAGHALLLDCRSLETRHVSLPADVAVVVLDTATRRGLVDSAYNARRTQCARAAQALGARALRDVTPEALKSAQGRLDPVLFRRASHVVGENGRVLDAVDALQAGDHGRLGALLSQSHRSLRDDFEVSSEALDAIVSLAERQPACYGARMTGAGFGGCAVALVAKQNEEVDSFVRNVRRGYAHATGHTARIYVCQAAHGAQVFPA